MSGQCEGCEGSGRVVGPDGSGGLRSRACPDCSPPADAGEGGTAWAYTDEPCDCRCGCRALTSGMLRPLLCSVCTVREARGGECGQDHDAGEGGGCVHGSDVCEPCAYDRGFAAALRQRGDKWCVRCGLPWASIDVLKRMLQDEDAALRQRGGEADRLRAAEARVWKAERQRAEALALLRRLVEWEDCTGEAARFTEIADGWDKIIASARALLDGGVDGPVVAGDCWLCGDPVYHRPGKPGEFDHECRAPADPAGGDA